MAGLAGTKCPSFFPAGLNLRIHSHHVLRLPVPWSYSYLILISNRMRLSAFRLDVLSIVHLLILTRTSQACTPIICSVGIPDPILWHFHAGMVVETQSIRVAVL